MSWARRRATIVAVPRSIFFMRDFFAWARLVGLPLAPNTCKQVLCLRCSMHCRLVSRPSARAPFPEVVEKSMQLCGPIPLSVRENGRLTRAYWSAKGFHPEVARRAWSLMVALVIPAVSCRTSSVEFFAVRLRGKPSDRTSLESARHLLLT